MPSRAAIRERKNALVARGVGPKNAAQRKRERENELTTLTYEAPYKACSGFTRVSARRIAQPPKATFVARLRPSQLPDQAARQLPDPSTTIRVRSSLTDDSRLRGALPFSELPIQTGASPLRHRRQPLPRPHQVNEAAEQVVAVLRPRRGLRVVLHREHRPAPESQPAV